MHTIHLVSPSAIERETGFTSEQLRKWRQRFGFPLLDHTASGKAAYSRKTIGMLLQIKRLLKAGFRPRQVVGKTGVELDQLCQSLGLAPPAAACSALTHNLIDRLTRADLAGLRALLEEDRARRTLLDFVLHTVVPLLDSVGAAWARNDLDIHHEHLCTSIIERCLHAEIRAARARQDAPKFLFAVAPGEKHVLGMLMAEAVLAAQGAQTLDLGRPVPLANLPAAAVFCQVDVLALSFSAAYPARNALATLQQLRRLLPEAIQLWAGGCGVAHIRRPPKGVRLFTRLEDSVAVLQEWSLPPEGTEAAATRGTRAALAAPAALPCQCAGPAGLRA